MFTVMLSGGRHPVTLVGGKAAQLSDLLSEGVEVPPGFVVTTESHRAFLARPEPRRDELPAAVAEAIDGHLAAFPPDVRFAVRSSAILEDLTDASFAGQYETFLDVPQGSVKDAVLGCWASALTSHARQYARGRGLVLDQGLMGVLVQRLVPADVAGVAFSIHPVTRQAQVVVNAAYGLGEGVVSGFVTPDAFEIDKATGQILTRFLGLKEVMIRPRSQGGTETIDTLEELASRFCLSDQDVARISSLTIQLERLKGVPVDIEWAIADGALYCLQMRAITA